MQALSYNPTLSNGAQLLAQAKAGEARSGKADLVAKSEFKLTREIEQKLESLRLYSDSTLACLVVLKALHCDAKGSLEALSQMKSRRRSKSLPTAMIQVLCYVFEDRSHFRKLIQLMDDFGISEDADARRNLYDGWLKHEMKFGVPYKDSHPLLDPEVFSEFIQTVRSGEPAIASFPSELQQLIGAGQVCPARDVKHGKSQRVLVVSDNWNFFPSAAMALEADGFELRYLDFEMMRQAFPNSDRLLGIAQQTRSVAGKPSPAEVREALAVRNQLVSDLINWADVVFCEWLTDGAVWMSRYLPEDKALIARLHSYEAFTSYPFLTNLPRFDGLIFIAPQIQEVFNSLVGSATLSGTVTGVIPNFRNVSNFSIAPRQETAKKTLGLTQYASANKDPIFALDILKELRAHDPTWQLRLIGQPWSDDISEAEANYRHRFEQRLAEFGDSVSIESFTNDIVSWYRSIGFIVSASQREGSHESFVEGMLTGAVPVLRNWPMMAPFGAPGSVFPNLSHFDTAADAADYVRNASDRYGESSRAAAEYAVDYVNRVDPAVELPRFVRTVCRAEDAENNRVAS